MGNLLEIQDLNVAFTDLDQPSHVISGLSFSLGADECLGIVGESGSGKSVASLSIMRLLPDKTSKVTGKIIFKGQDLLACTEKEMQEIRGNRIAMIFQEPMTSLNPIKTCGDQIAESVMLHSGAKKKQAMARALELLELCGIPDPAQRIREYPHQMSGGMRQRVMIAIALACSPEILIADEPTTALDVTIQAQILALMKRFRSEMNMGIIMITHDLGIVYDFCDRVIVMYTGEVLEAAPVKELFETPRHPYTRGLIGALPQLGKPSDRLEAIEGMVPDVGDMPAGCHFHPRCPHAVERCRTEHPGFTTLPGGRQARCFLVEEGTL